MKKLLMVTFSKHASFQDGVFSMYEELCSQYDVYTLTRKNNDYPAPHDKHNYFITAPENPGFSRETLNFHEINKMISIVKTIRPDIIYFESFHFWNFILMCYCKKYHIRITHAIHDFIIHPGDAHRLLKTCLNKGIAHYSDRIIIRSKKGFSASKDIFSKYINKLYLAELWFSFPEFHEPSGDYVLFFGRMNRYKGIDNLYSIIRQTPDIKYVVAGKADDADMEWVNKIGKLKNAVLCETVIPYADMHDYFFDARCTVLPYKSATQSAVVIDSNKHSRPSVAFSVGALSEQIINTKTGYLVAPDNLTEMENRIRTIVNMPEDEYRNMCLDAYSFSKNRYSAIAQKDNFLKAIGMIS